MANPNFIPVPPHIIEQWENEDKEFIKRLKIFEEMWKNDGGNLSEKELSNNNRDHYGFYYKGIRLDPYRVLEIYKITNHAQAHAIKKLLRAGRGHNTIKEDIEEAIASLERMVEMMDEDINE